MSIFAQYADARAQRLEEVAPAAEVTQSADPLDGVVATDDAFAEQRERRNAEMALESIDQVEQIDQADQLEQKDEPVDGEDEDMKVGKSDSDVDVAEGEYGLEFTSEEDDFDDGELDVVESDHDQLEQLENQMRMLDGSYTAVETYGINPTAMGLLKTFDLLGGTALESMGLEDLGFRSGQEPESVLALESLGEKLKETVASWGAKIMSFAKNAGTKIVDFLGGIWTKISSTATSLASAAWDQAKTAGRAIKAHPVRSLMIAAAAIAAVAGVVALVGSGTPAIGAKLDVVKKFGGTLVDRVRAIKWPFGGGVKAAVAESGKVTATYTPMTGNFAMGAAQPVAKLGWSKAAVNSVLATFNRSWGTLKTAWTELSGKIVKMATSGASAVSGAAAKIGTAAGKAAGAARSATAGLPGKAASGARNLAEGTANKVSLLTHSTTQAAAAGNYVAAAKSAWQLSGVIGLVMLVFKLTRYIVGAAFRMVMSTFGALRSAVA